MEKHTLRIRIIWQGQTAWSVYGQVDGSCPDALSWLLWVVSAGEPPVAWRLGIFPGAELRLLSVSSWTSCQVPPPVRSYLGPEWTGACISFWESSPRYVHHGAGLRGSGLKLLEEVIPRDDVIPCALPFCLDSVWYPCLIFPKIREVCSKLNTKENNHKS